MSLGSDIGEGDVTWDAANRDSSDTGHQQGDDQRCLAEDHETEGQAVIMEDKLRKDVAYWSGEHREQLRKEATDVKQPVVKRPSPQPAGGSKGPLVSRRTIEPAAARSRPFSMSYDGMTEAQYIQYRLDRGAR